MGSDGCFDKLSGSHHQSQVKSLLSVKRTEYSSCNNRFSGCLGLSGDERQYQLLLLLVFFFIQCKCVCSIGQVAYTQKVWIIR